MLGTLYAKDAEQESTSRSAGRQRPTFCCNEAIRRIEAHEPCNSPAFAFGFSIYVPKQTIPRHEEPRGHERNAMKGLQAMMDENLQTIRGMTSKGDDNKVGTHFDFCELHVR